MTMTKERMLEIADSLETDPYRAIVIEAVELIREFASMEPAQKPHFNGSLLPALPEPDVYEWVGDDFRGYSVRGYTDEQMIEYARKAVATCGIESAEKK